MHMTFDGTVARLHIQSARTEMTGSYKCQIVNEFGKEESTAQLTVNCNSHRKLDFFSTLILISYRQKEEGKGKQKSKDISID